MGGLATVTFFGCGDDDDGSGSNNPAVPPPGELPPALAAYFAQLVSVRDAVRKSPDHTRGRADQVVASRDPNLILRFVRDEIALLAPHGASDRPEVGLRWGVEGVLRGGSGTFRERAELLAALYVRAGFTAKVRLATLPKVIPAEVLYRRPERVFNPPIDDATMRALWKSVGKEPPTPLPFDPDGVESKKLASDLLALLPGAQAKVLALSELSLVPMVTVTIEGVEKLAYPYGNLELSAPAPSTVMADAPAANAPTAVRIALSMSTAMGAVSLVEAVLGADQVVGRQVILRAPPPVDPATSLVTRAADVHLFVPTLAITSPSSDTAAVAASVKSGLAITDSGSVVKEDATGLSVAGVPLTPAAAGAGGDGSTVANVTVVVNPAAFPRIELQVSPTDAAGKPVSGLAASAIRIGEDAVDQSFIVVENAIPKPRVLVVYDTSASIPPEFSSAAGRASFGSSIAEALQTQIAGVELQALGTAVDTPSADKWSTPTPTVFGDAIVALAGGGSYVWTAVRNAAAAAPAVIVLLSDFEADEKTIRTWRASRPRSPSVRPWSPSGSAPPTRRPRPSWHR